MATALIVTLRARVTEREKHYADVESLATLAPGDDDYRAYLIEYATASDPTVAVRQALDVKVRRAKPLLSASLPAREAPLSLAD